VAIRKVQIVSIPVSNQERSRDWYHDALGFEVVNDSPMGPTMRWLQMGVPDTNFSITLVTWFDAMPPGSVQGLMFEVDDVDASAADLHARGFLDAASVDEQPWGRWVGLKDPDGNNILLQTPPK
jgi:catechol 2,3-dioxygenase-like lactoylglutathione lyase family enzyme